ncbi:MAG: hypothetical protein ACYCQJ_10190 [Nitrososphaerales archaeon]
MDQQTTAEGFVSKWHESGLRGALSSHKIQDGHAFPNKGRGESISGYKCQNCENVEFLTER